MNYRNNRNVRQKYVFYSSGKHKGQNNMKSTNSKYELPKDVGQGLIESLIYYVFDKLIISKCCFNHLGYSIATKFNIYN